MVAVLWAAPLASQQAQLNVGQVQQIAVAALRAGDANVAARAADALIQRNPNDPGALILRTEAAVLAGDFAGAVTFGQRAHWNASSRNQSYAAARLVALAHAEQRNDTRAQSWLRLARQTAPNDKERAEVARDFQFLRARNPLSVNLRFGITPSSNVNNGSSKRETDLFDLGLPFVLNGEARALSGYEIAGSTNLRYRLRDDQTSVTFLDVGFSGRTYVLTDSAQDQAGDGVDGSDFSSATLSLGVTHRFILAPDMQPTSLSLSFGQSWFGGDANAQFVTASVSQSWEISPEDTFVLSGFVQDQRSLEGNEPIRTYNVQGTWARDLDTLGDVGVSVAVRSSQSDTPDADYESIRYGVNYAFPEPIFGIQLGANYSFEDREFENSRFSAFGRDETITSASLRAVFTDLEFLGFQPVLNVEKTVQESTTNLFDREFVNFGFDITSSF